MKIMVDSGAFSFYVKKIMKKTENPYAFFETDAFWNYVDEYANFIKKHESEIETYVNVDVIFNPDLSWKTQKYLEEKHGLHPLPVFHAGEDIKYFKRYLDNYDYIGVSGTGKKLSASRWHMDIGDPLFSLVCPAPRYLPKVKLHGFSMTNPGLIADYPWYSFDSTSWVQYGKFGLVILPSFKNGKYDYSSSPIVVNVSTRLNKERDEKHIDFMPPIKKGKVIKYFEEKGFSLGKSEFKKVGSAYKLKHDEYWVDRSKKDVVEIFVERGLCNDHNIRSNINLQYYLDLEEKTPPWPMPWQKKNRVKITRFF